MHFHYGDNVCFFFPFSFFGGGGGGGNVGGKNHLFNTVRLFIVLFFIVCLFFFLNLRIASRQFIFLDSHYIGNNRANL